MTSHPAAAAAGREQALRSLDRLPPFSPILNKLLASMASENVSFANLAELIEKDTVLAGNVLRLVNSALYGLRGTVNSVRHAVAILGLERLRKFGLSLSVARIWTRVPTPPGWSPARFNLHSVATGILADLLAPQVNISYPEGAFVAGLLHDLGKLLTAIALPREYLAVRHAAAAGRYVPDCELEAIGATHAELSGLALAKWNLPAPIQCAVTFHHAPEQAEGGALHLAHVLRTADALANQLGHTVEPTCEPATAAASLAAVLGVSDSLPRILEQFAAEFDALKAFF